MPMQPFDQLLPEIARAEARICDVLGPDHGVPMDSYFLREFYCTEPGCDCRRVVVQFISQRPPIDVAASINFGWEKAKYYRRWSRDPVLWREMAGATLEPLLEQGPQAKRFLVVFKKLTLDPALVTAFRRHYRLVKESIGRSMPLDPL